MPDRLSRAWLAAVFALAARPGPAPATVPDAAHPLALLEPPRVLHGWGQISGQWTWDDPGSAGDETDLAAYRRVVGAHAPAMVSFYVAPVERQVTGFLKKYPALLAHRPFAVAQVGLYFLDRELQEAVAAGRADGELRRLFAGLRNAGPPVLLRIGHEFNGHEAAYDPTLYVPAFRRVAALAREVAPGRIACVWSAEPVGLADADVHRWDPGDAAADWWGLSLFFPESFTDPHVEAFVAEAARRHKPVLIGEASPWFHGPADRPVRGAADLAEERSWYERLFGFVRAHPDVKAVSVIVVDWTRWRAFFPQVPGGFPDVRLGRRPALAAWYRDRVADALPFDLAAARAFYGLR